MLAGFTVITGANYVARNSTCLNSVFPYNPEKKIESQITDRTEYVPLGNNTLGIDYQGDGKIDATRTYLGMRPGFIIHQEVSDK